MFILGRNGEKQEFSSLIEAKEEAEKGISYKLKWKVANKNPLAWILVNRGLPREEQIPSYALCTITKESSVL
ncbi:MAG: hypothetical protein A3D35_01470 [Candidatus Staskawiczbacteria bacterium RIFCSPHIGHO2_02_FULL_34_9]|uniref:Uncharacterized protein n=1 Tax=Candidatus Staskawiczbacteria bacterium RIFCSPHIGHO2_02_FULL_34_9 TaxID=1802206 RepID=A0A1G2HZ04_9BACT|nr:MAG: hypothetical protein A3D35_01470 [Candidatus Staskawiczbacteria bacterium RIFCSPHIGHO2_02_FULL_34_9]